MKCQRCCRYEEARYRVHSELIDMKVCGACAAEAGRLGIAVELLREPELPVTDQSSRLHAPW